MNKAKILNAAAVAASMSLVLAGAVMPVFAEDADYSAAGSTSQFENFLVMDGNANVPNATFSFTATPGQPIAPADGTQQVKAGIGTPTISDATFAPGDTTYTEKQGNDSVTLAAGQKYAKTSVTVDFSGITFTEPGIYRYVITESGSTQGVTNDSDSTRLMDVYVTDNDGALGVSGYVLHNGEDGTATVSKTAQNQADKSDGYSNEYATSDLTLSKKVTGNQGSKDRYFKFTVQLSGGSAGTKYAVDLSKAEATTKITGDNTEAHTNPTELTVGADGTVTQDFWLKNGQSIVVRGMTAETGYSITEDKAAATADGYTATAVIIGDTTTGEGAEVAMSDASYTVSDDKMASATTVAYTNDKQGIIPTGIIMNAGPGAVVGLVGAVGVVAIVMGSKKKKRAA